MTLAVVLSWGPNFRDVRLPHHVLVLELFFGDGLPTSVRRPLTTSRAASPPNAECLLLCIAIHQYDTMLIRTAIAERTEQVSSNPGFLEQLSHDKTFV